MAETKSVRVVDRAPGRRAEVEAIARKHGLAVTRVSGPNKVAGTIGHRTDLEDLIASGAQLEAPVVHYRGTESFRVTAEGHYRFPKKLDKAEDFDSARELLADVFEWFRNGGDPPSFLLPERDLLGPLVPFGVLLEGFLLLNRDDAREWFKAAIEAADQAPPGTTVLPGDEDYWHELRNAHNAVGRIRDMLAGAGSVPGFGDIVNSARALQWLDPQGDFALKGAAERAAADLYERGCWAVHRAWSALCSCEGRGVPRNSTALR